MGLAVFIHEVAASIEFVRDGRIARSEEISFLRLNGKESIALLDLHAGQHLFWDDRPSGSSDSGQLDRVRGWASPFSFLLSPIPMITNADGRGRHTQATHAIDGGGI